MAGAGPELTRLRELLKERNRTPERQAEVDAKIRAEFECRRAVLVLDMAGFTRTVKRRGIVHYLAMIERMAEIAIPIMREHGAGLIKRDADNLFVLFESVPRALDSARQLMRALEVVDEQLPEDQALYVGIGIGYGDVLVLGDEEAFGNEVNVAAKLGEDLAQREIFLTPAAREQLPADASCREVRFSISGVELVAYRVEG